MLRMKILAHLGAVLVIFLFVGLCFYGMFKLEGTLSGKLVQQARGQYSRHNCDSRVPPDIIFAATKYKGVPMNSAMFFSDGCPDMTFQCDITDNIAVAKYAKAVIFHNADFDPVHYEKLRKAGLPDEIPKIWFSMDAPSDETVFIPNMTFDYILSYRNDSDIKSPYGYVWKRHGDVLHSSTNGEPKRMYYPETRCSGRADNIADERMTNEEIMKDISSSKNLTAAWISPAKCNNTESQSYALIEKIIEAGLKVDIYGDCSETSLAFNCKEGTLKQKRECKEKLLKPYKFYFVFEDTICNDFITEDFFTSLRRWKAVPIVFKRDVYENNNSTIPSGSFIAMDDFNSIADFVSKINRLKDNEEKYMQYHEWRETARVFPMSNKFTGFCNLCQMISFHMPNRTSITNIQEWYTKDQCDNSFTENFLRSFNLTVEY